MNGEHGAKPRIKQNRWGNWYGYLGTQRVVEFGNLAHLSAEEQAADWLNQRTIEHEFIQTEKRFGMLNQKGKSNSG